MSPFAKALARGCLLLAAGCAPLSQPRTASDSDTDVAPLLRKSSMVFDATVVRESGTPSFLKGKGVDLEKSLGRSTFMLVRVDAVHFPEKDAPVRVGSQVWVAQLPTTDPADVKRATWYAQFWMSGDQLVVREVGHETDLRPTDDVRRVAKQIDDENLAERLNRADTVILGEVRKVEPPAKTPSRESEHDPAWQLATVKVNRCLGGAAAGEEVTVQFAASMDVAWYRSPKLKQGDVVILILRRKDASKPFAVIDPEDRRSSSELKRIETLIKPRAAGK
jgi:hypothetical protein